MWANGQTDGWTERKRGRQTIDGQKNAMDGWIKRQKDRQDKSGYIYFKNVDIFQVRIKD